MMHVQAIFPSQAEYQDDLRGYLLQFVLPALLLGGSILFFVTLALDWPQPVQDLATLLAALPLLSVAFYRRGKAAVTRILCSTLLILILTATYLLGYPSLLTLIALPIGLAGLLLNSFWAALLGGITAGILLLSPEAWFGPWLERILAIGLTSSICSLLLITRAHAQDIALASWKGYHQMRRELEAARQQRLELKQAQEDLGLANRELARLTDRLRVLRHAAEEARRTKQEFVAKVSHELRTPLNMIIGFTEMILETPWAYGEIPPALLADLTVVHRNSEHLSELIDDILDLSQIEAGRWALTRERVMLQELVAAAVTSVKPLYQSKGLYLRIEFENDIPPVYCDRTRIREVLVNLLSNAGRFTDRGGVVVRCRNDGQQVTVEVEDTGPGIRPEDRERLFQPFEQLDGSIRRRYGGTGLGLSISKAFVELHGGTMSLESELGHGTTVSFTLPIDTPPDIVSGPNRWFSPYTEYQERPKTSRAPLPKAKRRFVVWERGQLLGRILKRYADAEIVSVSNLEAAKDTLAQEPCEALLVNDTFDGPLARCFRDTPSLPYETPIVLCNFPQDAAESGRASIISYLVKPVSRSALNSALNQLEARPKTVLVVDDDPEALRLFQRMLIAQDPEVRVFRAADGQEALNLMRQERPDVVLLDLVMPTLDGFRVLEIKANDPAICDIPVLIISARDPVGQPILSNGLALIRPGGLSVGQVLRALQALTEIATNC